VSAILVGELTADARSIVLVANGPDHELADMARWLKLITPLVRKSDPPGALQLAATWPAVVQLGYLLGPRWRPGPRLTQWLTDELISRTGPALACLGTNPPEGMVPRDYQIEGALMIGATGRGLLFDEQGTGKTITTILGLVELAGNRGASSVLPVVCVVPASVVDAWVTAWQAWAPQWRAVAWRGAPRVRHALAGTTDVYVTSYDTARMDAAATDGPLVKLGAAAVVVDECHLIKSPHAMRSLAARRLAKRAKSFVALSGTPITHHPGNLWPTMEALEPRAYPSSERWIDRYCAKASGDYRDEIIGLNPVTEPELRASLLGQHRRVAKADVLDQLPPKVYSVRTVELPAAWRKTYDDFEAQMYAELPDGQELSIMEALSRLTHLATLACAPCDVRVTVTVPETGPKAGQEVEHIHLDMKAPSWKVDALLDVLAERPGQPVLAFTTRSQLAVLAGQAATAAGLQVGYVIGGQSMRARTETVERFQHGKLDLLCATTGAGGVGLTLTAAGTQVHLQRPWSIVEALQAEDRSHRIGSEIHDSIEIIDIVAANTIDSRVRLVLQEKAGQLADLFQDPRIVTQLLGGVTVTNSKKRKVSA